MIKSALTRKKNLIEIIIILHILKMSQTEAPFKSFIRLSLDATQQFNNNLEELGANTYLVVL